MEDCIFCRIIKGEIPSTKVFEDEISYAFRDINPQAPVHILIVPKEHVGSVAELTQEHEAKVGRIFTNIAKIAKEEGLESGFRVISNTGADAGQTVPHLHFHILGGKSMGEGLVP
ncbi:MAG: histidine triad nucleotide-binding protein [Lachnospiraceae bacterium]|nr:histidine triad nucleotide-binding protein [Lachnospiraceae bacterium]